MKMNEKLPEPDEVFPCGLTIEQQRAYIEQLKKVIAHPKMCKCCPARKDIDCSGAFLEEFLDSTCFSFNSNVCLFCHANVGLGKNDPCPCGRFGKDEALRRAKNFIERFEKSNVGIVDERRKS